MSQDLVQPTRTLVERPTVDALADAATDTLTSLFRQASIEHPVRVILAGGNSPSGVYRRWAQLTGVDWAGVEFYFGDERCVSPDSSASNAHLFEHAFMRLLPPTAKPCVHRIEGERPPQEAAALYAARVRAIDVFDVAFLGLGTDGHTASLFPEAVAASDAEAYVVKRDDYTRVTLALSVFSRCQQILFFAPGEAKRPVVDAVMTSDQLPAGQVARLAPATFFATNEAQTQT